jgi:hypothetical protein
VIAPSDPIHGEAGEAEEEDLHDDVVRVAPVGEHVEVARAEDDQEEHLSFQRQALDVLGGVDLEQQQHDGRQVQQIRAQPAVREVRETCRRINSRKNLKKFIMPPSRLSAAPCLC